MNSVAIHIKFLVILTAASLPGCRSLFPFATDDARSQQLGSQAVLTDDDTEDSEVDSAQQMNNLLEARAALHEMDNQPREALAAYESILQVDPEHVTALHRSAILNAQQGNTVKAEEQLQSAIRLAGDNAVLHKDYGYLCHLNGKLDLAQTHLTRAVALDPLFLAAHNVLGIVYARLGRYEEAKREFQLAKCDRAEALNNIAFARLLESDLENATAMYTQALQEDPNQINARKSLDSLARMSASQITMAKQRRANADVLKTGFDGSAAGWTNDKSASESQALSPETTTL